jgi:23S rRNA (guanosine2251-2'-O)-methyltransferase
MKPKQNHTYKEKNTLLIFGKHPVVEKLERDPKSIEKIFIKETLDLEVAQEIKELASKSKVPFLFVPERKLTEMTEGALHQGLVAIVAPVEYIELKDWLESIENIERPCVLILDELEDQHNIGAIIRTAVAAGVHGIIMPKHRQAPVGGVAYKTAVGLIDKIPLIKVTNVNEAIRTLKEYKFWVVGLHQNAEETIWTQDLDMPVCFIVGSEGDGMRQKTGQICDFLVRIPMKNGVESLNASVSAAVMMYEWRRRQQ